MAALAGLLAWQDNLQQMFLTTNPADTRPSCEDGDHTILRGGRNIIIMSGTPLAQLSRHTN